MKERFKRGLSPVIAVVLLLMITVVAAGLIVAFVIPFAKENLSSSKDCFDVLGKIEIEETPFNCFVSDSDRTGFSVRVESEGVSAFRVALEKSGSSDTIEIRNSSYDNVRMLLGNFNENLRVPEKGGVRTYVVKGVFDSIDIFPVLKSGKICEVSDKVKLKECTDPEAITNVGSP